MNRFWSKRNLAYLSTTLFILCLYSYPALHTGSTTGYWRLPATSAPDLGLYLSLSSLNHDAQGAIQDPYYHQSVPASSVGFLKFRLGPQLYDVVTRMVGDRMGLGMFVWNLFWWTFLCLVAVWLFSELGSDVPATLIVAGVSILMLWNFAAFRPLVLAWRHFPSPSGFVWAQLPYIRPFFPQMAVALVLCYVALQIRALTSERLAAWAAMAMVQFVAFAAFPYAMLLMAGTTAVAAIWYVRSSVPAHRWRRVLVYGLLCAGIDAAFLLWGPSGFRTGSPDRASLIHFQLSLLPLMISRSWLLIGILVLAATVSRKAAPGVRWTIVGMGLSNMILLLGDSVVSETAVMLSDHSGYFIHSTITTLLVFLAAVHLFPDRRAKLARIACIAATGICLVTGLLVAEATYRNNLPFNREQADIGAWLGRGEVRQGDLIISNLDACEWVPLLSNAEVLYCRTAQCLLTPEQNQQVQRYREVLYLYLAGRDRAWIESTTDLARYGFYYEQFLKGDRARTLAAARGEILSIYRNLERGDPAAREFFGRYNRIWIVENVDRPVFSGARITSYLKTGNPQRIGNLEILPASAK